MHQPVEVIHPLNPIYDRNSRILILGTFPSVKSREAGFYYAHPQNRFWQVIAALTHEPLPLTHEAKTQLLLSHHIALWDVIRSCEITGSSDASIRNVIPNPLKDLIDNSCIDAVYANGTKACHLYRTYSEKTTGFPIVCLPSTSPANARSGLEALITEWSLITRTTKESVNK